MANSDVLVRMKADTQNYDANIAKARRQLDQFKKDNLSLGGAMKQTTSQLMGMATQFASVAAAIGAATKVVKDAFMASESNIDEWGRTVESAKGIYEGFLTSINTGDISGFLSRIREVINASKNAYDALDRLGTQKAINNAEYQMQTVENERYRAMLRTGRYIAPNDGRSAEMADGTILTKEQKAKIAADLENGLKTINQIVRDEIDQTTKSINELYTKQAKVLGMSEEEFREGTKTMAEFDERMKGYAQYIEFEGKKNAIYGKASGGLNLTEAESAFIKQANPYESYKAWGVFKDDGDLFTQINQLINQRASLQSQNYSQMAQAYRSINTATGVSAAGGAAVSGSAETPAVMTYAEDSIKAQEAKVAELTRLWKEASAELRDGYYAQLQKAKSELEEMTKGPLTELKGQMSFAVEPVKIKVDTSNLKLAKNDAQGMRDAFSAAASAVATVGGALQQIEDPAAKVAGIIAAAIAQVALTFASSLKGTIGPWDWIAAATAGLATMISTITAIKAVTNAGSYAEGGLVPGSSFSGDNLTANVNSGELILNRAQQDSIAAQLSSGNPFGNLQLTTRLSGTELLILLNNTNRSMGGSRSFYTERH